MSAVPVTAHQVRSKVAWVLQKEADALVVGLHAAGPWQGDGELDLGERRFAVVRADTVLEVREALADAEALARPTVVLTAAGAGRAGPGRRRPPGPRQALPGRRLGGGQGPVQGAAARPVAPRPLPGPGPAGAPPPGGRATPRSRPACSTPAPSGGPSSTTPSAWRTASPTCPACSAGPRTAPGRAATSRPRPNSAPPRASAWPRRSGPAAGSILDVVEAGRGPRRARPWPSPARSSSPRGPTSPPSWPPPPGWSGSTATGRSRRTSAGLLARAGHDAIDDLDRDDARAAQGHLLRADALLREVQAAPPRPPRPPDAARPGRRGSAGSPGAGRGDRRRGRGALAACRGRGSGGVADHAARPARAGARDQFERAGMALRLARWLRTPEAHRARSPSSPRRYRDEVAFVDWARDALAGGDDLAELSDAYARLGAGRAPRAGRDSTGRSPRPWPTGPQRLGPRRGPPRRGRRWPGRSPAVLAAKVPVLLVVLDGMSWPVVPRAAGRPAARTTGSRRPCRSPRGRRPRSSPRSPASPSSRGRACWPGWLHRGKQDDERRLFPANPALLSRCERNYPAARCSTRGSSPRGAAGRWPRPVARGDPERAATGSSRSVINAVDDRLAGAQQVRDTWTVEAIRPLGALLQAGPRVGPGRGPGQRPRPRLAPRPGRHAGRRRRRPLAARRRRRRPTARSCWRGRGCAAPRATPPADRPLGRGRPLRAARERLPRRGDAPGDGRPAGRCWPTRPPASPCWSRASRAGRPGGTGRTPGDPPRPSDGARRPPPEAEDARRLPVPAGAGPAEAEARPRARRGPRAGRGRRPTRPGCGA